MITQEQEKEWRIASVMYMRISEQMQKELADALPADKEKLLKMYAEERKMMG
mgnify:CR=1 FL=1